MLPEGTRIGEEVDSKSIAPQGVAGSSPVPSAYLNAPPQTLCFRGCFWFVWQIVGSGIRTTAASNLVTTKLLDRVVPVLLLPAISKGVVF